MTKNATITILRLIPRDSEYLDRKIGSRGEIFYDQTLNTLCLYDGDTKGGTRLAKSDLTNVSNTDFLAKATAAGVGGGSSSGGASVDVGASVPSEPENGNLWLNTQTGRLYIYIEDEDSGQWIQPNTPFPGSLTDIGITDGTDGQYLKTDGDGNFSFATIDLSSYVTTASLTTTLTDYATTSALTSATANSSNWDTAYGWGDHADEGYLTAVAANSIGAAELDVSGNGNVGQVLTSAGDGSFTWEDAAGGGSIGSFTFIGTVMDTDDSSGISVVPAVTLNSDLTVENELTVRNNITAEANITVQGTIITQGSGTPELYSDNEIQLTAGTRVEVTASPLKMASFTTVQRDALLAQNGDVIYNSTDNKFQGYENGSWVNLV